MTIEAQSPVLPVRVRFERVVHTSSNNRVSWIGRQVVVVKSDGVEERCPHTSGHRADRAARSCAQVIVDRINRAAGIDPRTYKTGGSK